MRRLFLAILVAWAGAASAGEHETSEPATSTAVHPERSASAEAEARSRRAPTSTSTSTATASPAPAHSSPPSATERAETYTGGKGPVATPPSLTANALGEELKRSSRDRRTEKAALAEERARLEKLDAEISSARAALREETKKLQELLASGGARPKHFKGAAPGRKGAAAPSPLAELARTVKGMKPEPAAQLLSRLDRSLAAAILEQMRAADAAAVVEKMDPGTGAALFALLARSTP